MQILAMCFFRIGQGGTSPCILSLPDGLPPVDASRPGAEQFSSSAPRHRRCTMSPNSSIIHCGLDVAKSSLDLHCQGRNLIYPNDPAGLRALIALLLEFPQPPLPLQPRQRQFRKVNDGSKAAAPPSANPPKSPLSPSPDIS